MGPQAPPLPFGFLKELACVRLVRCQSLWLTWLALLPVVPPVRVSVWCSCLFLFVPVRFAFEEVDRKRQIQMLSGSTQFDAPRWPLRRLLCLGGSPKVEDACFCFPRYEGDGVSPSALRCRGKWGGEHRCGVTTAMAVAHCCDDCTGSCTVGVKAALAVFTVAMSDAVSSTHPIA